MVTVQAVYPGASAETLEQTVAAPLENAINGVPRHGLHELDVARRTARCQIQVTFDIGTNVDTASVNVNNRVKQVEPRLPEEVRRQGVTVETRQLVVPAGASRSTRPTAATTTCSRRTTSR